MDPEVAECQSASVVMMERECAESALVNEMQPELDEIASVIKMEPEVVGGAEDLEPEFDEGAGFIKMEPEVAVSESDTSMEPEFDEGTEGINMEPEELDSTEVIKMEPEDVDSSEVASNAESSEDPLNTNGMMVKENVGIKLEIDSDWSSALPPPLASSSFAGSSHRLCTDGLTNIGIRPYKCKEEGCAETFTRVSHLKRHVDSIHRNIRYQCSQCPSYFCSHDGLTKHERRLHGNNPGFRCGKCSKVFKRENHLVTHMASHDGQKPHGCETCGKRFNFPNKLRQHRAAQHEKNYGCNQCSDGVQFNTWNELRTHMSVTHSPLRKCDACDATFKSLSQLREHAKSHMKERELFHCTEEGCDRVYLHIRNLNQHIDTAHRKKGFLCTYPDCGKMLCNKRALLHHQKLHEERGLDVRPPHVKQGAIRPFNPDKKYKCMQCSDGVLFESRSHLMEHAKIHKLPKMFHCSEEGCDRAFFNIRNLNDHFNTAHKSNDLPCPYPGCENTLCNEHAILRHQQLEEELCPLSDDTGPTVAESFCHQQLEEELCTTADAAGLPDAESLGDKQLEEELCSTADAAGPPDAGSLCHQQLQKELDLTSDVSGLPDARSLYHQQLEQELDSTSDAVDPPDAGSLYHQQLEKELGSTSVASGPRDVGSLYHQQLEKELGSTSYATGPPDAGSLHHQQLGKEQYSMSDAAGLPEAGSLYHQQLEKELGWMSEAAGPPDAGSDQI